ncbi:kinase-like domain-containing protein [Halenospora varia]|nr:kinase-like domain-containing protein [Halenospora varia]
MADIGLRAGARAEQREKAAALIQKSRVRHQRNRKQRYIGWLNNAKQFMPWLSRTAHDRMANAMKDLHIRTMTGRWTPPLWDVWDVGKIFFDSTTLMDENQKDNWLASSRGWADVTGFEPGFRYKWRGTRLLGVGGYGIVGLWESTTGLINSRTGKPAKIVVKQSGGPDKSLREESNLLKEIRDKTNTYHVVRLEAEYFEEVGQATSNWDRGDQLVSRIFLEFCENGDMSRFLKSMHELCSFKNPVPEEIVWRFFECMARWLCILQDGQEDANREVFWREISHFDVKPQNVLIGGNETDHTRFNINKIADFGLAAKIPIIQTPQYHSMIGARGTRLYLPPEQYAPHKVPDRTLGSPGNVWQVAKCIYELMSHGISFRKDRVHKVADRKGKSIVTFGRKLVRVPGYSEKLKLLVFWCLALDPRERPTPRQLLYDTTMGLHVIMQKGVPAEDVLFPPRSRSNPKDTRVATGWSIVNKVLVPTPSIISPTPTPILKLFPSVPSGAPPSPSPPPPQPPTFVQPDNPFLRYPGDQPRPQPQPPAPPLFGPYPPGFLQTRTMEGIESDPAMNYYNRLMYPEPNDKPDSGAEDDHRMERQDPTKGILSDDETYLIDIDLNNLPKFIFGATNGPDFSM